ncbi:Cytochrome c oxidase assembly factor 3, mitochondrial [Hypsizygus marmoreus]|uniref:Cytochrome c oxidase assembly factor 3 n=1 Tax=Hypsizygus marmoreus TaxID=39966 RepID=A0A369JCH4_HYPMA|nr:Cytochrome c oxidase assembly factor 3, mitochondrial [Hypsizygus marmoreus]
MSSTSQYVDRKTVNESYRPRSGLMSPGLKRAREPYLFRNALTGLVLGAFAVGVWAYSISAVKQDVFDDVDEEAREMARVGTSNDMKEEQRVMEAAVAAAVTPERTTTSPSPVTPPPSSPSNSTSPASSSRGLLQYLDGRFPRLLDPQRKTLVWGAPPVDNVGKIGKS